MSDEHLTGHMHTIQRLRNATATIDTLTAENERLKLIASLAKPISVDRYPNLDAVMCGCVSGSPSEWPRIRREIKDLTAERDQLRAELAAAKAVVSMTYGDLPQIVADAIVSHEWDNKTPCEQRDWAVTRLAESLAAVEKLRAALTHIAEYWNRSENDKAMNDALYHMIDTAEAALASGEKK